MTTAPPGDDGTACCAEGAHDRFWRSIAEAEGRANEEAVQAPGGKGVALHRRRDFMKLMAASVALAGTGCSRAPLEQIVPYRQGPAEQTYGRPVFYASTLPRDGYGFGVLVETNMGRPTKIEGNPLHPASAGATDVFAQAAILDLWDPDRSQMVRSGRVGTTWNRFLAALEERLPRLSRDDGTGLRILTETVTSPSLAAQIGAVLARYPGARWHQWQPVNRDNAYAGAALAYGTPLDTLYRLDRARVVVSLDGDLLDEHPASVRHALDFSATRSANAPLSSRSRLYAIECTPTLTGANADHRLALRASDVALAAGQIAGALGIAQAVPTRSVLPAPWLQAVIADLRENTGRAVVVAGHRQPPRVHALAHAMNARLSNSGNTVVTIAPVAQHPQRHVESVRELLQAMHAGDVDTLLMTGVNPVYTLPAELGFTEALARVPFSVHHGLYADETAVACTWHVPAAHPLESWGDLRSCDGTLSFAQPTIASLYGGKSAHELIAPLTGDVASGARDLFVAYWRAQRSGDFDGFLEDALRTGVVAGSTSAPEAPAIVPDLDVVLAAKAANAGAGASQTLVPQSAEKGPYRGDGAVDSRSAGGDSIEVVFVADPRTGDGRHANNAWLQELPKPLSQLTWDNPALVGPALARRLGLDNEDVVKIRLDNRELDLPVWIMPGMPDGSVTLSLGYGRRHAGAVGNGRGFDVYPLRSSDALWIAEQASITRTDRRYALAAAQTHHDMQGRDLVRTFTVTQAATCTPTACGTPDYRKAPTLYDSPPQGPYAWAMSIDLSACIGCGTCTIACQAENNIPTVGKDEVRNSREMHWIRVDRYYTGRVEDPRTVFQPVPCMQCEHAPCEVVCPVEASVHDAQGINVQVYNRCVGTRFCSNNCPYKVRRFNFLAYAKDVPGLAAQRNPEVTVRMRGVMEKCNYCLQRITTAKIDADREGRALRDGDVVTACQAACPTRAIVFGDLNDVASEVNARKRSPLDYALLVELNTRPRTTYLPRVTNPAAGLLTTGGRAAGSTAVVATADGVRDGR